jgi:hypothetical protein
MISAIRGLFSPRCGHCKSVTVRSVGVRNSMEQAFYWLLQPYRCSLCGHHLFRFRWQVPVEGAS